MLHEIIEHKQRWTGRYKKIVRIIFVHTAYTENSI